MIKPCLRQHLFNSEIINALAMRPGVSTVIYGDLPVATFGGDDEPLAARFYVSNTLALFRRYLVENVFGNPQPCDRVAAVARITRWMFSIIRASLRLFDVYAHPYEPSLTQLATLFPTLHLSLPYTLTRMRANPATIQTDDALFLAAEAFIEQYSSEELQIG